MMKHIMELCIIVCTILHTAQSGITCSTLLKPEDHIYIQVQHQIIAQLEQQDYSDITTFNQLERKIARYINQELLHVPAIQNITQTPGFDQNTRAHEKLSKAVCAADIIFTQMKCQQLGIAYES